VGGRAGSRARVRDSFYFGVCTACVLYMEVMLLLLLYFFCRPFTPLLQRFLYPKLGLTVA